MKPFELFNQAGFLATPEGREATDADLRRAISACYYALFHAITADAASQAAHAGTPALRAMLQRSISHVQLAKVCELFSRPLDRVPDPWRAVVEVPSGGQLLSICRTFRELQDARHDADYNPIASFDLALVEYWHARAEDAHERWKEIRQTPNGVAFLVAVLLYEKLGNRG